MIPSLANTSRFASATAATTGWPPNVIPCVNELPGLLNGSNMRSVAITAPIGA